MLSPGGSVVQSADIQTGLHLFIYGSSFIYLCFLHYNQQPRVTGSPGDTNTAEMYSEQLWKLLTVKPPRVLAQLTY